MLEYSVQKDREEEETKQSEQKQTYDFAHFIRSVPVLRWDRRDKRGCQTAELSDSLFLGDRDSVFGAAQTNTHTDQSDVSSITSQPADCGMG